MLKKLILKLFVVVLPVITLFFVHMYMIVSFAEKLSDNVVNGKLSYVLPNYNGRRVERKIIEKQMKVPETLFLGTSPIYELSSDVTGYEDQLILSPGGGFFVDWLGILGLYKKQGRGFPKRVVWEPTFRGTVQNYGSFSQAHIFKDTYAHFYDMQGIEKWRCYLEHIIGIVKESCQFTLLFQGTYACKVYEKKEDAFHPELLSTLFPSDGHGRLSSSYDGHIFVPAALDPAEQLYYDPDYYPEKMSQYFNDLKGFCIDNCIEFVVLLPPIAPNYIDSFNSYHASDNLSVESVENYIRQLAGDCLVRGTFSPYDLHLTNADFIDETHVKRDKLKQMWDYIK